MRKILLLTAMYIGMIFSANGQTSVWDGSHSTWTNGAGTQDSPYLIENAAQLAHLAYIVNNGIDANDDYIVGAGTYWKLMTDIDLNGSETFQWTPIGYSNSSTDYYYFGGTFDGNDHTVANLYINTTTLRGIGLFGYTFGAKITNLGIIGTSSITNYGTTIAGTIAGYAINTGFNNCYNTGSISASSISSSFVGGIIGCAYNNTTVDDCYNTGSVSVSSSSISYSGGIVGEVWSTITINNCYNTGSVSASSVSSSSYSGGIVGSTSSTITVNNCYNTGSVVSYSAANYVTSSGGIVGDAESTTVNNCYNTGHVLSFFGSGGIAGDVYGNTTINNCYNTGTVVSYYYTGGIVGYAADATSNNTVNYSYYLDTCEGNNTYGGEYRSEMIMKNAGFVTSLNQGLATPAWGMDCTTPINHGFPILLWQTCAGSDAVETIENQSIIIYPNPAKDIITIASSELQNANYTVFSISGQALMQGKLQGETTTVNVSALPSGIYYLKVADKTAKFIKN